MTDHVARLYALALALVVFLVAWAAVAANPFPQASPDPDPRLIALQKREARLAREQERVNRLVARRYAVHRRELAITRHLQATLVAAPGVAPPSSTPRSAPAPAAPAAPAVTATSLPPVTSSGSS